MDVGTASVKIKLLMREHDLFGWRLLIGRGKKLIGATRPQSKTITISGPYISLNDWDEIQDTVLHEIAHALTWDATDGHAKPHGPEWRAIAKSIGAEPTAKNTTANIPPRRYTTECSKCGQKYGRDRFNESGKLPGKYRCSTCKWSAPALVWKDSKTGREF
jgi:predicted SprT family Zn-dependent metalloprotease